MHCLCNLYHMQSNYIVEGLIYLYSLLDTAGLSSVYSGDDNCFLPSHHTLLSNKSNFLLAKLSTHTILLWTISPLNFWVNKCSNNLTILSHFVLISANVHEMFNQEYFITCSHVILKYVYKRILHLMKNFRKNSMNSL